VIARRQNDLFQKNDMAKMGLILVGAITSALVVLSGWDGLAHFPQVVPGGDHQAWELRIKWLWWPLDVALPVTLPTLALLVLIPPVAWFARRTSRVQFAFGIVATACALGTILAPLFFLHFAIVGTSLLITPESYWVWIMTFGAISATWFALQAVKCMHRARKI